MAGTAVNVTLPPYATFAEETETDVIAVALAASFATVQANVCADTTGTMTVSPVMTSSKVYGAAGVSFVNPPWLTPFTDMPPPLRSFPARGVTVTETCVP